MSGLARLHPKLSPRLISNWLDFLVADEYSRSYYSCIYIRLTNFVILEGNALSLQFDYVLVDGHGKWVE